VGGDGRWGQFSACGWLGSGTDVSADSQRRVIPPRTQMVQLQPHPLPLAGPALVGEQRAAVPALPTAGQVTAPGHLDLVGRAQTGSE
jgi:hypothetical protein